MRRVVVIAALLAAGALVGPAAVAQEEPEPGPRETGIGIRLLEAPTELRGDPRAQVYVIDHVRPGTSFRRRIQVANGTDRPLAPALYVAPARIEQGAFTIGARGEEGEVASWTTVRPGRVELAPRARGEAVLHVDVPADAPDGEYYGAAMAEVVAGGDEGVRLASRVGVRIYLSVGEGAAPVSDFVVTELEASRDAGGTPVVTARVRNTGQRALDMGGDLVLDEGPADLEAGPFPVAVVTTLAVGATEPVAVRLDRDTPPGPWRARLTLRSGGLERTVEATITFPETGEAPRAAAFRELEDRKRSWSIVAIALLLAVLLALLLLVERERRRRRRAATGT